MRKLTTSLLSSALLGLGLFASPALAETTTETEQVVETQNLTEDRILGNPDAPITIIEYASLTCGHCATFHKDTLPTLKSDYIETGKVKLIMRNFPLNRPDLDASMLTRCVAPQRFYSFVDALMKSQEQWAFTGEHLKGLRQYSAVVGLNGDKFDTCLKDKDLLTSLLKMRQDAEAEYEINSTPTFIIQYDGKETKVKGAQKPEYFAEILNGMID